MKHGDWFWHELTTNNPDACKGFYGGLLGWDFEETEMPMPYTLVKQGGAEGYHGGIMRMEGPEWEGIRPHWMVYMVVEDCDAACAKVADLGGKVCAPPFDIPTVGRCAVIEDPSGAVFSIMTPAEG